MSTAREFFESTLPAKLTPDLAAAIGAHFQFNIDGAGGGSWTVDLTQADNWIQEGVSEAADCTIAMKEQDFLGVVAGTTNPQMAFMLGKIKVTGNLALSLKLPKILG
ncbi:MAG: SCP2 sterol-binding domain-containing protein [Myxococcota bacterium]|nr:SCP2 sterol-binding domain-containing protein [Myxococcota bacterium]